MMNKQKVVLMLRALQKIQNATHGGKSDLSKGMQQDTQEAIDWVKSQSEGTKVISKQNTETIRFGNYRITLLEENSLKILSIADRLEALCVIPNSTNIIEVISKIY